MSLQTTNLRYRNTASLPATIVPAAPGDMLTIDVKWLKQLFIQITVATAALTAFVVKGKSHKAAAAAVTIASAAADFTTPKGLVKAASGDLTIQGVGSGWLALDVGGLEEITINATSGGTATIAIDAGGESE